MKIALILGHNAKRQGAVAKDGCSEFAWNGVLMQQIGGLAVERGHEVLLLYRTAKATYAAECAPIVQAVNAGECDVCMEIHFNSEGTGKAEGVEVLHWPGSVKGAALARELAGRLSRAMGTRNRGAVPQARSWSRVQNGQPAGPILHTLKDTRCPAVILESHYGSNLEDHAAAHAARESGAMAQAVIQALEAWYLYCERD